MPSATLPLPCLYCRHWELVGLGPHARVCAICPLPLDPLQAVMEGEALDQAQLLAWWYVYRFRDPASEDRVLMAWIAVEVELLARALSSWASAHPTDQADLVIVTWHQVADALQSHQAKFADGHLGGGHQEGVDLRLLLEVAGRAAASVDTAAYLLCARSALRRAPTDPGLGLLVTILTRSLYGHVATA